MAWLNYHHLLYFWTVAREGTIARATQKLHLTQPTISANATPWTSVWNRSVTPAGSRNDGRRAAG